MKLTNVKATGSLKMKTLPLEPFNPVTGKTYTVSQSSNYSANTIGSYSNLTDGNYATGAATANASNSYIQATYGEVVTINRITIGTGTIPDFGNNATFVNKVQYYDTTLGWVTIRNITSITANTDLVIDLPRRINTDRLRIFHPTAYVSMSKFVHEYVAGIDTGIPSLVEDSYTGSASPAAYLISPTHALLSDSNLEVIAGVDAGASTPIFTFTYATAVSPTTITLSFQGKAYGQSVATIYNNSINNAQIQFHNGVTWESIHTIKQWSSTNNMESFYIGGRTSTQWRISGGAAGIMLFLDKVLFDKKEATSPVTFNAYTLSQSSVYSGMSAGTYAVMTDHLTTTGTGTQNTASSWIEFDLGSSKSLTKFIAVAGSNLEGWGVVSAFLNGCNLQYYNGSTWVTKVTITGLSDTGVDLARSFDISGVSAQRWRLLRPGTGYIAITNAFFL